MTNHHCGRNQLSEIQEENENLLRNGFYAKSIEDERKIKNLFVDQLMFIEDVTAVVKNYIKDGKTNDEMVQLRDEIKDSLVNKYNSETGLISKIVTLYHGGKYSLYGYKRYDDIRLVMAPDFQIAATGWDWDNFTYPRYELDFMFYRAYNSEGHPVNSDNYFKWSKDGAKQGEPIFVIGRPGSTDRLYSIAELEYLRDDVYPNSLKGFNAIYNAYYNYYVKFPEREELLNRVMRWGNARKSYAGRLAGLNNKYIMRKKIKFQQDLKMKVESNNELMKKYGHVWEALEIAINELKKYSAKNSVSRFNRFLRPEYYNLADKMIKIAEQKKLPNEEREDEYKEENLLNTIEYLYPEDLEVELQDNIFMASLEFLYSVLDSGDPLLVDVFQNKKGSEAIIYLKSNSRIISREGFSELAQRSSEDILNSDDPFIKCIISIEKLSNDIKSKVTELQNTISVLNELLGEVVYLIYGDNIPPDATSTLRISDGTIRGYEYNGTIAPGKTTFYGLWDRYESFNKKTYPWGLHERWKKPPSELNLSTHIGFASTNDIVGGNSGSSLINLNKEVVGLAHDGNIESLAGHTIFLEENNRTVSTDSKGLLEALKYVYKTKRLVNELLEGKIN